MNNYKLLVITLLIAVAGAGYIFLAARIFVPEQYKQSDFLRYQLMTPEPLKRIPRISKNWYFLSQTDEGSGIRTNEIIFTGIMKNDVNDLTDKIHIWANSYSQRHETMSVSVEEKNGQYEVRVTHYGTDEN